MAKRYLDHIMEAMADFFNKYKQEKEQTMLHSAAGPSSPSL